MPASPKAQRQEGGGTVLSHCPSRLQAQLTRGVVVTFEFLLEAFFLKYELCLALKGRKIDLVLPLAK